MPDAAGEQAACQECGGRGWVVVPDGRAGSARLCDCRKQELVPRLIARSGVPPRYESCRFSSFKTLGNDQLARALALARRYADEFVETATPPGEGSGEAAGAAALGASPPGPAVGRVRFRPSGLLFVGPTGVGKTHLAVAVLQELIQRYAVRGRFVDFSSLLLQIQSTFDSSSADSKHDVLDPIMRTELLVLDELGAQKSTPWVSDILYLILNHRYTHRLPTIFTTNCLLHDAGQGVVQRSAFDRPPDAPFVRAPLSERISKTLISRLHEMAHPIEIETSDYREVFGRFQTQLG